MKKLNFLMMSLLALVLTMNSCGDDKVTGCMDANAENFNADATVDDGMCTYASEKFIGTYLGTSMCEGGQSGIVAGLTNDTLMFEVKAGLGTDPNEVTIAIPIEGTPVAFSSTVSGDVLTVDSELNGLPFTVGGNQIFVNVIASGMQTYNSADNSTSGDISVTITAGENLPEFQIPEGTVLDMGTCLISGVKQ